jgi:photosystem II stability/assembly factor-like uncharacterized protein
VNYGLRRSTLVIGSLLLLSSVAPAEWHQVYSGVTGPLYSVHFPEGTLVGYAAGAGQDSIGGLVGVILKTTDRGETWQAQDVGHVNVLNSVYFTNDDNGYVVGQRGEALRTTDGGATWTAMTIPGTDNLTKVQFPEDGLVGYIGVNPPDSGGKVLKTTDGGGAWSSIGVGGPFARSYSCGMATDSIGVVVGYDGMVYGTTDGCSTFTAQDPQTTADIVAAAFSTEDPNWGYLIGNDSTPAVTRFTEDGGTTPWQYVRCWVVDAFYAIDMPTSDFAWECGTDGMILWSLVPTDFYRSSVPSGLTATMYGIDFPNGVDTGYAVGEGGVILRTFNGRLPLIPWIAEGKGPVVRQSGVRVVSNPSRCGITFHADADVNVVVFDAAGRVVARQAATKGTNFLPLPKAGVYVVKTDDVISTQKVVVGH